MRAFVIRHGQTDENLAQRFLGRRDPPLNRAGEVQAAALADHLARVSLGAVYTSGLARAASTARAIATPHGLSVVPAPALVEMDVGEFDGLSVDEGLRSHPEFFVRWRERPATCRMPGGETLEEVQARAWTFLLERAALHGDANVVFVTHTFVALAVVCRVLGLSLDHFRRLYVETGSISIVNVDERRPAVLALNVRPGAIVEA